MAGTLPRILQKRVEAHPNVAERARARESRSGERVLDPRAFHLFEAEGVDYFYDAFTGTLAGIDERMRVLLELCSRYDWEGVSSRWDERRFGPLERGSVEELKAAGLFVHADIDQVEQQTFLDALWAHNPRRIQLLTAQMCNLKCVYCYEEHNGSNARKLLMSFETAKRAVDHLVERSGARRELQITFFGGEPLLNYKTIRRVVSYCESIADPKGKEFTFEIITNGTLLEPEILQFLISKRFLLMISLDGYEEMNNFNRPSVGGKDYHDVVVRNAVRAVRAYRRAKLGLPVKIRANLTHEHCDLERTVEFLEGLGFATIGVAAIENLPWAGQGVFHACDEEDIQRIGVARRKLRDEAYEAAKAGKRARPYGAKVLRQSLQKIHVGKVTRGLRCGVGRNTNIVDVDGNIYPCHRYGNMGGYVLGNIEDGKLDASRTMAYYKAVNEAATAKCNDCWAKYICGGPCAWEVSRPDATILEPDDTHCARIKRDIQENLLFQQKVLQEAPHLIPEQNGACACSTS